MLSVKVNPKGQITLPREIRRKLQIKPGDQMAVILEGEQIVFKPFTKTLLDMRGSVKVKGEQDFDKVRREALKEHAKRNARSET
ncbi:MAG TPA: AbrB/MazE/SpoVT family DNA-binding domain-containing protein [Anaerolineales bacterium]|nr:AbrB/MazE/SpoVT family DNA-binding domain-containing protein [Anaerolineales bacterium]